MRRREMWIVTFVTVLSLILISGSSFRTVFGGRLLVKGMHAAGAYVQEVHINGWAKLSLPAGAEAEGLEETVHAVMGKLIPERRQYHISRHFDQHQRLVRAEYKDDQKQVTSTVQIIGLPAAPEQYIIINILAATPEAPGENPDEWQNKVAEIIEDMGGLPRISTCLVGWLDGKLEEDQWMKRLHTVLNALDATSVSVIRDNGLVSVTGYSPGLPGWLVVENRRINVNLAMRYSLYDNRTYITIGSPVITREY